MVVVNLKQVLVFQSRGLTGVTLQDGRQRSERFYEFK